MTTTLLQPIALNLWMLTYPLKMLGADFRRNVTLIRLRSGQLVIHSTAPFSPADVETIHSLGEPSWILDGTLRHDTFAKEGKEAFPELAYLGPVGFSDVVGFETSPLVPPPDAWADELLALEIQGAPDARDTAMLHTESQTLILTELVFNFGNEEPMWTEIMLNVAIGGEHHPGMSRPFKWGVKDAEAFEKSLELLLSWDFDRVIVGHGDVIETGGKAKLREAIQRAGFLRDESEDETPTGSGGFGLPPAVQA